MKLSIKGLTGAATMLAAALGLNLLGPHRAYAAPSLSVTGESDLGVTILSPDPHVPLAGLKPVEISAFYQGTAGNQIVSVDLILDGAKVASKTLDLPETRGVVSFLVDASQISAGTHKLVVRATAADQEVKSSKSEFTFGEAAVSPLSSGPLPLPMNPNAASGAAPTLHMIAPTEDGKVRGIVALRVEASDPSGKSPYVSLFIDKAFKTLRNFAPYEFEWDTTTLPNGYHTVEAFGYNDSPNVGHSQALHLYVNNPGGETQIRHDLLDGPKLVMPIVPHFHPRLRLASPKPFTNLKRLTSVLPLPGLESLTLRPAAMKVAVIAPKKGMVRPLPLRRPDHIMSDALMASVLTAPLDVTHEMMPQMAHGAFTPRLRAPGFAADLTLPFVTELAPPPAPKTAKTLTPMRNFKPLPVIAPPVIAPPVVDGSTAQMAEMPTARRISGKSARLQQVASLRLPDSELASPFVAVPHVGMLSNVAKTKIMSYRAEMHFAHNVIKHSLKMHSLRVYFPSSLGSLLRSVGQTSVLFNHTTVKMDRPISLQGNVVFGPLRQIFEQGGGSLTWQSRSGTVHAKNATRDIVLTIGQKQALVNAKTVVLDGKPYLLTGRTMVPLSFVSAALDADVQYDAATGHLLITSRK